VKKSTGNFAQKLKSKLCKLHNKRKFGTQRPRAYRSKKDRKIKKMRPGWTANRGDFISFYISSCGGFYQYRPAASLDPI
jgi:hypothetical protein